jgi:folate-binding protein YgfZ
MERARLTRYGLLSVTGDDARAFLHAQLTNDIEKLPSNRAALAGWCSAKGRLLASFLVIPADGGFLLQLARDLAPAVAKRLSMFILRSKVKIADVSDAWQQMGIWGEDFAGEVFSVAKENNLLQVKVGDRRALLLGPEAEMRYRTATGAEEAWTLEEIRAGRPFISAATQDQFVPQMVNLETIGGVDFQKGCYPGQEIVARAQYRGQVKRRMVRLNAPAGTQLRPGDEFNGGVVVDAAGGELLAVLPV